MLALLPVFPGLAACGGGGQEPQASFRIQAPDDADVVAVAVTPSGHVIVKRGVPSEAKARGRGLGGGPVFAREIRVVADGGEPWSLLTQALARIDVTRSTTVEVVVVEDGDVLRRLSTPSSLWRRSRASGRSLCLSIRCLHDGDRPILEAHCSGNAWVREVGCGAVRGGRWP